MEGPGPEPTISRTPRHDLVEALKRAMLSPRLMMLPLTFLGMMGMIVVIIILGFRSMHLDDMRDQLAEARKQLDEMGRYVGEMQLQRVAFLKRYEETEAIRARMLESLGRIEAKLGSSRP